MGKAYDSESIQKLDPLEFTRLRPDTYCGSTADSTQLVREIISNSVDEHLAGHCWNIIVKYDSEYNIIEVKDDGQGIIPMQLMPGDSTKTVLECAYGEINVSGKYDKNDGSVYETSTGAFGIGSKLTTYLSHWLEVTSQISNGRWEQVIFKEGRFSKRNSGFTSKEEPLLASPSGIVVRFQPSEEFFDNPAPNIEKLREYIFMTSCVCPKLRIKLCIDSTYEETFYNPDGLYSLCKKRIGTSRQIASPCSFSAKADRQEFDITFFFTEKDGFDAVPFCNYSTIEAGTPVTQVKTSITQVFNKWGQDMGLLKKNETLPGNLLQDGMIVAFNLVSPNIRYDSQTKVRVTSTVDNPFIGSVITTNLREYLDTHISDGKAIIERASLAKKASEAAKRAKNAVLSKEVKPKQEKLFTLPTKLIDAWSKERNKCELLIVEGDSAAGPMVAARNGEFQAVFPVRGKIINAYKQTAEKLLANQEINNLIQALGLEFDKRKNILKYDINRLRYSKIISCTDADEDGKSIRGLLFTFLWSVCPELFLYDHMYMALPSLYRVTTKKNEYVYLKDDAALASYKKSHGSKIQAIGRMKGLGECDSDELEYMLTNPKTRNIARIYVPSQEKADKMFKDFYGKDVKPRVEYIFNHSKEAVI